MYVIRNILNNVTPVAWTRCSALLLDEMFLKAVCLFHVPKLYHTQNLHPPVHPTSSAVIGDKVKGTILISGWGKGVGEPNLSMICIGACLVLTEQNRTLPIISYNTV